MELSKNIQDGKLHTNLQLDVLVNFYFISSRH